jgi:hypothetical protein
VPAESRLRGGGWCLERYLHDKPDLTCKVPPADRWGAIAEHWLLVIGHDSDTFVFSDLAEASAIRPRKADQEEHFFGRLFYDSNTTVYQRLPRTPALTTWRSVARNSLVTRRGVTGTGF